MGDIPWIVAIPLAVIMFLFCIAITFYLLDAMFEGYLRFLERKELIRELRSDDEEDDNV